MTDADLAENALKAAIAAFVADPSYLAYDAALRTREEQNDFTASKLVLQSIWSSFICLFREFWILQRGMEVGDDWAAFLTPDLVTAVTPPGLPVKLNPLLSPITRSPLIRAMPLPPQLKASRYATPLSSMHTRPLDMIFDVGLEFAEDILSYNFGTEKAARWMRTYAPSYVPDHDEPPLLLQVLTGDARHASDGEEEEEEEEEEDGSEDDGGQQQGEDEKEEERKFPPLVAAALDGDSEAEEELYMCLAATRAELRHELNKIDRDSEVERRKINARMRLIEKQMTTLHSTLAYVGTMNPIMRDTLMMELDKRGDEWNKEQAKLRRLNVVLRPPYVPPGGGGVVPPTAAPMLQRPLSPVAAAAAAAVPAPPPQAPPPLQAPPQLPRFLQIEVETMQATEQMMRSAGADDEQVQYVRDSLHRTFHNSKTGATFAAASDYMTKVLEKLTALVAAQRRAVGQDSTNNKLALRVTAILHARDTYRNKKDDFLKGQKPPPAAASAASSRKRPAEMVISAAPPSPRRPPPPPPPPPRQVATKQEAMEEAATTAAASAAASAAATSDIDIADHPLRDATYAQQKAYEEDAYEASRDLRTPDFTPSSQEFSKEAEYDPGRRGAQLNQYRLARGAWAPPGGTLHGIALGLPDNAAEFGLVTNWLVKWGARVDERTRYGATSDMPCDAEWVHETATLLTSYMEYVRRQLVDDFDVSPAALSTIAPSAPPIDARLSKLYTMSSRQARVSVLNRLMAVANRIASVMFDLRNSGFTYKATRTFLEEVRDADGRVQVREVQSPTYALPWSFLHHGPFSLTDDNPSNATADKLRRSMMGKNTRNAFKRLRVWLTEGDAEHNIGGGGGGGGGR